MSGEVRIVKPPISQINKEGSVYKFVEVQNRNFGEATVVSEIVLQ